MDKENDTQDTKQAMGRRSLMKAGSAAVVVGVGATALTVSPAGAAGGKAVNLLVTADFGTFTNPSGPGVGSFYIKGPIAARSGGPSIGTFHCWGFLNGEADAVVNQEFDLDGRGKILIAGIESTDPRGVIGGTGDFANARGQGIPSGGPGSAGGTDFTIDFNLTGASGPPIG
jgi:hypothetical protein